MAISTGDVCGCAMCRCVLECWAKHDVVSGRCKFNDVRMCEGVIVIYAGVMCTVMYRVLMKDGLFTVVFWETIHTVGGKCRVCRMGIDSMYNVIRLQILMMVCVKRVMWDYKLVGLGTLYTMPVGRGNITRCQCKNDVQHLDSCDI